MIGLRTATVDFFTATDGRKRATRHAVALEFSCPARQKPNRPKGGDKRTCEPRLVASRRCGRQ